MTLVRSQPAVEVWAFDRAAMVALGRAAMVALGRAHRTAYAGARRSTKYVITGKSAITENACPARR